MSDVVNIAYGRYGKSQVRLVKVNRPDQSSTLHSVTELVAQVLLEGDFDMSFTTGDNSTTVPTDTIRNTVYVLAKLHDVDPIEKFAQTISNHFLSKYPQTSMVHVELVKTHWDRVQLAGSKKPHDFAFTKREPEVRVVEISHARGQPPSVRSSIKNLVVLKTTGNGFDGFPRVCVGYFLLIWLRSPGDKRIAIIVGENLLRVIVQLFIIFFFSIAG